MRKRNRLFTLLFSLLILSATSCKKDPIQYTFSGTVTESANGNALSNVAVEVLQRTYNGSVASAYFNSAASTTTASDGTWEVSFDREKVFEFKIEIVEDGYFELSEIISSSDVSTDETEVVNYALEPKSWLSFHLKNFGGLPTDEFTMIYYNFREGCDGCSTNDYHYFIGEVDTTFQILTTGGVYAKYAYKNPGGVVYITDSVYMPPLDTVGVTINY
ncbi:MAG: hypothetical protein IPM74_07335 [Crocinitomicaceae bacterium]|nr:hypothetical protein [Crocinitomicaceae bacterium]MBK8925712.1 hypothetical protein [Crocinitomicaceae bacterium]